MRDLIYRQAAIDLAREIRIPTKDGSIYRHRCIDPDVVRELPSAQPQYTELTPEEAASEIASGSTMSAYYWLDDMIRLKQMGYVICRKKG